jgi:cytochrome c553
MGGRIALRLRRAGWRQWALFALAFLPIAAGVALLMMGEPSPAHPAQVAFLGHQEQKGCAKCHEDQYKSWLKTKHGKAIESLEAGKNVGSKRKAKLDPDKDFTKDKDCLKCHVTGLDQGGYVVGNRRAERAFVGVGCETCHGPGGDYQPIKDSYPNDDFPRDKVIVAGMKYGEQELCTKCHNTDKDNPFPEPHFIDESYEQGLKESHKHFKQKKHPPRKGSEWLYEES